MHLGSTINIIVQDEWATLLTTRSYAKVKFWTVMSQSRRLSLGSVRVDCIAAIVTTKVAPFGLISLSQGNIHVHGLLFGRRPA